MADPFEVRMKFTAQLQHLNASINSSQKAANYAIKYKEQDEDLHSCILEQLEKNNMNVRANIMFFIEQLCDMAQRESHNEYVSMVQRDILRIIDAVAPSDGSGAANVKVVRRVIGSLQSKSILTPAAVIELEECLKQRDIVAAHPALSPPAGDPDISEILVSPTYMTKSNNGGQRQELQRPDKKQIEQRIEEDRERHKRQRESIWAVPSDDFKEFEMLWDDASEIGEDDYMAAEEDAAERRQALIDVG